jgi:nucleotide-binding universal stress UspA family protein
MRNSKCLLVATDFSATSTEALRVARELSLALGARVQLLHVIADPARLPWTIDAGPAIVQLEHSWRQQAERALEKARDAAGFSPDDTTLTVAMGDPAREITAAAHGINASVIVLGTHGHGFVARLVMGSVADKVVRRADRPVLIVPHPSLKDLDAAGIGAGQAVTA